MPQLFTRTLSLLPWISAFLCGVTTAEEFEVLEGRSLTVPCHYDPQYASYVKYWCQGRMRDFCTSLARTDDPRSTNPAVDKVSIFDDPVQLVFTVTMNNLKEKDSGWYMCGVEVAGIWSRDVATYPYIKVIHGMSVVNNILTGEEGSSVSVECLYSKRYREIEKKWCRSGDWSSCLVTDSEGSYEDTSVAISDDRTTAFTVTLKNLQMRDIGWYWCSSGYQKIAVQVLVTPRPTTTTSVTLPPTAHQSVDLPPPGHITMDSWHSHGLILKSLLVCSSLMALLGLAILIRKKWKLYKDPVLRQVKEMKARRNEYSRDVGDLQDTAVIYINKDSQEVFMH
ncbi:polymeric immunoglobulin receptor [Hippoglossus hippoglossus]|uniref:polymeric immunoglobulin receptor n=1 Tax=Hippoglossus hippoglossus TaxID=8267 RepID=UPI00148CDACA|nr:polymeric immunoglobulin receptor [Hippoglossus hippoglossus]XP_035026987.1 polymeric immunoglobulin receptor [Hippoglossus stenolepis]